MPRGIRALLLFLALLVGSVARPLMSLAFAVGDERSIRFEHLTERDGLSQGCAYAIHQDQQGFLWIGTQDGLNRFDGYEFRVYYAGGQDSTSLRSGWITDIHEGRNGILWLAASEVLTRFDPATETFRHYRYEPDNPESVGFGPIEAVWEDRHGGLWVGTRGGLSFMPADTPGRFRHFQHDSSDASSLSSDAVLDILEDELGRIWIATDNGLNLARDGASGFFTRYLTAGADAVSSRDRPWSFLLSLARAPGTDDVLWIGAVGGLIRLDVASGTSSHYAPQPSGTERPIFTDLVVDADQPHTLWIGGRGFYRFDTNTQTFHAVENDPTNPRTLPGSIVDAVYSDRSGTVWVSASCAGLSRFNTTASRFSLVRGAAEESLPIQSAGAGAVLDDGTIIAGARTGDGVASLVRIDRNAGVLDSRVLDVGFIRALVPDDDGTIWVAHRGLMHVDRSLNTIHHYRPDSADSTAIGSEIVSSILIDRENRLWVGTHVGLDLLDPQTGKFRHFVPVPSAETALQREKENGVLTLTEARDGSIWLSTRWALHRFDPLTERFQTFPHDPSDPSTVVEWIRWIYERPVEPGVLWLGGTGLDRFDTRTGTVTHFTTRDGLPNNTIYGILGDDAGRLWLSTNRGVSRFEPETGRFTNFGLEHGLQGLEFNEGSAFQAPDGEMFFGGLRGLTAFRPAEITHNPIPPTVVLTDLRLFNEPVGIGGDSPLAQSLDKTSEIRLGHDQNHVAFDFVGLHFQNPEKNTYAYRLDGFDADWIDAGTRREATYASLAPGAYTFYVRAANSDGVWSPDRTVRLIILPPWWQTWWAYALYAILLGIGIMSVHRFQKERVLRRERERSQERELAHAREIERANRELEARNDRLRQSEAQLERQNRQLERQNEQIEEQNRKLRELDELKSRFFANISHEFRTPLTLILGPVNAALRRGSAIRAGELPAMRRSARRLLRLINQLLDLSRLDAGAMKLKRQPVQLDGVMRRMVAAFSSLAERKGVALVYDGPPSPPVAGRLDLDKIEQIVTNLLSNAIKFTPRGGKVRLALREDVHSEGQDGARHAVFLVEDTGLGIAPEHLGRVFDRFYQVDETETRENEGTGIGLALTRDLVELHGGSISVESKPGFGACFTVSLPLPELELDEQADFSGEGAEAEIDLSGDGWTVPSASEEAEDETASPDAARGRVLVVDDNVDMRRYLQRILTAEGYVVDLAEDGAEGVARAIEMTPDLVIADVMMPRMDGFELCKRIRDDERVAAVPVVLLTARATEDDRIAGLEAGADDYLAKPFSPDELMVRLENLIQIRRRLRERFSHSVRLGPEEISVSSADARFIEQVRGVIEAQMSDSQFGVDALAEAVGLSPRQLHRRVKELTGLTTGGYIRMMRLERAEQLFRQQAGQVAEVAYAVGFNDAKYFSRLFRQTYGCTPSEYEATDLT